MSVRTDGWWVKWFGGGDRANNAAQHHAQMAAENKERVERVRQKHAEVQGYGVAVPLHEGYGSATVLKRALTKK